MNDIRQNALIETSVDDLVSTVNSLQARIAVLEGLISHTHDGTDLTPPVRLGTPPDYTEFNATGDMVAYGEARRWKDLDINVGSIAIGGTNPDFVPVNGGTIILPGFNGVNITEQVGGAKEMDHDWAVGTDGSVHVHWMPSTAAAGNVKWQFTYAFMRGSEVVTAEQTLSVVQAAGGTAWANRFGNMGNLDISGVNFGDQLIYRFFRDPTDGDDDYGADAVAATLGVHIRVFALGSDNVTP